MGGATRGETAEATSRDQNARREPGGFLRGKLISDHGLFSSYGDQQGAANVQVPGLFQGCTGLWTAGY